jgi:hypothetical protein
MTISCLRLEGFWRFMQNYRDSSILFPSFLPSTGNALIRNLTSLLLCTHEKCCDSFSGEASGSSKPGLPDDAAMERTTVRSRETGRRRHIENWSCETTAILLHTYPSLLNFTSLTSSEKTQLTRLKLRHDHNSFTYVPTHIVPWHLPH